MQPEHPSYDDYCGARDRRYLKPVSEAPKRTLGAWQQDGPREWSIAKSSEDSAEIAEDGALGIHCEGTYGEGGGLDVPLDVLRELLLSIGMRIVPVE